jgi:hypothetical protein
LRSGLPAICDGIAPRDGQERPRQIAVLLAPGYAQGPTQGAGIPHKKVFLLRDFSNVLSPGVDQLAEELKAKNIETEVATHAFALSLASEAMADGRSGRVGTMVLVGHSFGATESGHPWYSDRQYALQLKRA